MKFSPTTLLLSTLVALPALAESSELAPASSKAFSVIKHFDFEDDFVEGELRRPDGELIVSTNKAKHKSLIELRTNFIPEMMKTLEDL